MTEEQLWARLKQIQEDDDYDRIKITVVIKPDRLVRPQSRIAVHEGDTVSGRLVLPAFWVEAGNEERTVVDLVKRHGKAKVALQHRDASGEWTYETAVWELP